MGLDFTSSLYLGLRHDSGSLSPWRQLTTGVPGALREPDGATDVARRLAALQGCERATLAASTLHLFVDLLGKRRCALFLDGGAYEIARIGAELARARGAMVSTFPRHDVATLSHLLVRARARPVVVADGFAPGVGPLPLRAYLELVHAHRGLLVVDDTQALGVLGPRGGGSLRAQGCAPDASVALVCSLAKGFGAPLAALSASRLVVERFRRESTTLVHSSAPSAAAIAAARRALDVNDAIGERLRARLRALVRRFRERAAVLGLTARGGAFPVQELDVRDPVRVHEELRSHGVEAVLRTGPRLTFVLTAAHRLEDVDDALQCVAAAVQRRAA